jgi:predicted secreted protein
MKDSLSSDIKKAVTMVVDVDLQMQMNYINRDDFQEKMQEVDDKLVNKMGIPEFNEALQQFDEDLKEENKETYEYI